MSDIYEKYKLSRDYYKHPLEYGEKPPYEDVYKCMCEYCLPKEEIAILFNVIKSRVAKWCRFYKIKRTKEQINKVREITNIKKYGVSCVSQVSEFVEKGKQTSLERYGATNVNKLPEFREKIKKTNLERYGVETASQSQIIKERIKKNSLKKYGVESVNMLPEKIQKCKDTMLERYGSTCYLTSEEGVEHTKQMNRKNLGVDWPMQSKKVLEKSKQTFLKHYGTTNISNSHLPKEIVDILETKESFQAYIDTLDNPTIRSISQSLNITYDAVQKRLRYLDMWDSVIHFETQAELDLRELFPNFSKTRQIIPPYEIDLYNEELKLGIEYNGTYWHSSKFKEPTYHQDKTNKAREMNIFLYHIFEYQWINPTKRSIIISDLKYLNGLSTNISISECIIKETTKEDNFKFLEENDLDGFKDGRYFSILHNDEIILTMTINNNTIEKITYKKDTIVDTISLFNYIKNIFNDIKIVLPCSRYRYNEFDKYGFKLIGQLPPDYIYINSTCNKIYTKEEFNEECFALLWDCGKYVWK